MWFTIEKVCSTAIDYGELWKDSNKSLGKRRALSELLKLLESCGLSRHRPMFLEVCYKEATFCDLWSTKLLVSPCVCICVMYMQVYKCVYLCILETNQVHNNRPNIVRDEFMI